MAATGLKDIKRRKKSVNNTMKITKAMELVSSAKLKKAKDKLEKNKPYFNTLYNTMQKIAKNNREFNSVFTIGSNVNSSLHIVIAGDKGLAAGYNTNILKEASLKINKQNDKIVTFGNKASDFFKKRNYNVIFSEVSDIQEISQEILISISNKIKSMFEEKSISSVNIFYTDFLTSLTQVPIFKKMLPLNLNTYKEDKTSVGPSELILYETSADYVFNHIIPDYILGMIRGALIDSYAAEQASRRNAMESASDNAKEIIEKLDLMYNRARQSSITQEITEIVGGAEALN